MWVVDIIENCITLWNSTLSSIWSMLTQSPETFHNGAVWDAITKIFTALQGAGYGLLVLFFAMSFFKHTVSFREFRHPEQIIGYLIRFVAAKVLISQGMEVIKLIFKISGSFIGDIAAQMGGLTEIAATLPENIRNAIEDSANCCADIHLSGVADFVSGRYCAVYQSADDGLRTLFPYLYVCCAGTAAHVHFCR